MRRIHYASLNANLKRKYATLAKHPTPKVVITPEMIEEVKIAKAEAQLKQGQADYENTNHLPNRFGV